MIPIVPDITTGELLPQHAAELAELLNRATRTIDHCAMFNSASAIADVLHNESFHPGSEGHISSRQCMGAWQAGRLIGFMDAAVTSAFNDAQPVLSSPTGVLPQQNAINVYHGIIRTLLLPDSVQLAGEVKQLLLDDIEVRWREGGIRSVLAFLPHGGYQQIQAGIGVLPAQWREHFRLLTESGYHLKERYRAMERTLDGFIEEIYPEIPVSVETRNTTRGWDCELYYRRINRIGRISLSGLVLEATLDNERPQSPPTDPGIPVAVINELHIDSEWRNQHLGKFLLRKAINDAQHRGYKAMLMYLQQESHRGWSLLAQQGFQELEYRGYSFEKSLIDS